MATLRLSASSGMLFASPAYLKQRGVPKAPADLQHHAVLQLRRSGSPPGSVHLVERKTGRKAVVEVVPALVSDLLDPLLRATLEEVGISANSHEIAAPYVRAGLLRPLLPQWITGKLTLVAAYPNRSFLHARGRVFLEHFIEHVRAALKSAP